MRPSILAIRAIGAEFANRIYLFVAVTVALILACFLGLSIWLTTFSEWWWLLVILFIIVASIVIGVLVIIKLIIRSVRPSQSHLQKKQTKAFVDKLERLSEVAGTPKFILLFQVVRDIAAPRENGFIASVSTDTKSLKSDFTKLSQTFK
jgi:heme/copper-type cytochrome/quinol oxidase subunit 2